MFEYSNWCLSIYIIFRYRSVKFATLSHTPEQILENLKVALPAIAKRIANGWDNIQALHIKTNSSVSLPIWSCTLDKADGGRWPAAEVDPEDPDNPSKSEKLDTPKTEEKPKNQNKGKKRAQDETLSEKPKKKAKGVSEQPLTGPVGSTTTVTLTSVTSELKQKRSGAPGEKKKSKVNAVGAKSAKDRVLGKKAVP